MIVNLISVFLATQATPSTPALSSDALMPKAYFLSGAKSVASPKVTVDTSAAPDLDAWGKLAGTLMEQWYPVIWNLLGTEKSTPTRAIKVTFQLKQDAPAYAVSGGIFVSVPWVRAHPDDFGMMIHEMTHLIQSYPNSPNTPGWLVEGIADYTRWWRYEPEAPRQKITEKNHYTNAYRVTAAFLAYLTHKYDHGLVQKLDRAMKDKTYTDTLFETSTNKKLDVLWTEFVAAQPK
jgi:hypothetical protein